MTRTARQSAAVMLGVLLFALIAGASFSALLSALEREHGLPDWSSSVVNGAGLLVCMLYSWPRHRWLFGTLAALAWLTVILALFGVAS